KCSIVGHSENSKVFRRCDALFVPVKSRINDDLIPYGKMSHSFPDRINHSCTIRTENQCGAIITESMRDIQITAIQSSCFKRYNDFSVPCNRFVHVFNFQFSVFMHKCLHLAHPFSQHVRLLFYRNPFHRCWQLWTCRSRNDATSPVAAIPCRSCGSCIISCLLHVWLITSTPAASRLCRS